MGYFLCIKVSKEIRDNSDFDLFHILSSKIICDDWTDTDDIVSCLCGQILSEEYVYIMNKLKSKKLLDENEKLLCCHCYSIYNGTHKTKIAI